MENTRAVEMFKKALGRLMGAAVEGMGAVRECVQEGDFEGAATLVGEVLINCHGLKRMIQEEWPRIQSQTEAGGGKSE
jgi:hypothetical protein